MSRAWDDPADYTRMPPIPAMGWLRVLLRGVTLAMLVFALTSRRLGRWEGGLFFAAYCAYLWLLFNPSAMTALGLMAGR